MVANSGVSPNWQQLETMTIWVNASQAGFRTAVTVGIHLHRVALHAQPYAVTHDCAIRFSSALWYHTGGLVIPGKDAYCLSVSSGRFPLFHTLLTSTML